MMCKNILWLICGQKSYDVCVVVCYTLKTSIASVSTCVGYFLCTLRNQQKEVAEGFTVSVTQINEFKKCKLKLIRLTNPSAYILI